MWKRTSKAEPALEACLPDFAHIEKGFRNGRNVFEGYQRGVGIEFGELRRIVTTDPDFKEAYSCAEGRTLVSLDRLINLFLILKFFVPKLMPGHIVEYGSYNGGSALFMAILAKRFLPSVNIFALDTYAGMPLTNQKVDAHVEGEFVGEKLSELNALKTRLKIANLEFVQGLFSDTAADVMARAQTVSLVHIDCDIYDAVKFAYKIAKPHMIPRGYFVFDDPTTSTCLGAMEAVEECVVQDDRLHAEQVFPHLVFRQPE